MRAYVSRLVFLMVLIGSMLLLGAGPVAAHCVQTSAGLVDLSPGHFASAHGHTTAIASSGILMELGDCAVRNRVRAAARPGKVSDRLATKQDG